MATNFDDRESGDDGRDADFISQYGFGLPPSPNYTVSGRGQWRLRRVPPEITEAYLSETAVEGVRHCLVHGEEVWMSDGLLELESHAPHVAFASGRVAVAGCGMGVFAFAASLKSEVERVVVIDRDPDVVALMKETASFSAWPSAGKVSFVVGDALDPAVAEEALRLLGGRPDYLYADIWPQYPDPAAPSDTAAMCSMLSPAAAGWWCQELHYGIWLDEEGKTLSAQTFMERAEKAGVPVPVTDGYLEFCRDAIAVQLGVDHVPEAARLP